MKSGRWNRYIAPIVITAVFTLYLVLYFCVLVMVLTGFWKYALLVIPVATVGVLLYVCIERINEIRKGEEDDLSKY